MPSKPPTVWDIAGSILNLKRQLLLVSLATLALPWASCQYVSSLEQGLLDRREAVVLATAAARATALAYDTVWVNPAVHADALAQNPVIYAHAASTQIQLDGYARDWSNHAGDALHLLPELPSLRAEIRLAMQDDGLYFLLQVKDRSQDYFDPARGLESADRVTLTLQNAHQISRQVVLLTSAPGEFEVLDGHNGLSLSSGQMPSMQVIGKWRERKDGYQIEARILLPEVSLRALQVTVADKSQRKISLAPLNQAFSIVSEHTQLYESLRRFEEASVLQSLINIQGWRLAAEGTITSKLSYEERYSPLWIRLQRRLLGDLGLPDWPYDELQPVGIPSFEGVASVFTWYQHRHMLVARAVFPIELVSGGRVFYIYEQAFDSVDTLTQEAVSGLLGASLLVVLGAAGALFLFACVLSFRIRRLSQGTEQAVDIKGRLTERFRPSTQPDEIGDLSRNFHMLLQKQAEHQRYLESLADKLSHELRTPLGVIRSSLDNLLLGELGDERVYVDRAMTGVDRLSVTLRTMVDAGKLEQSIHAHTATVVELNAFLKGICDAYQSLYRVRNIDIRLDVSDKPLHVRSSEELLAQLLDKLLENAADFHKPSSHESGMHHSDTPIVVAAVPETQGVMLSVSNVGLTVDDTAPSTWFDAMVSRRGPEECATQHMGLGLYVVRLIAEWHGSTVEVEQQRDSNHALGTLIFKIYLPWA